MSSSNSSSDTSSSSSTNSDAEGDAHDALQPGDLPLEDLIRAKDVVAQAEHAVDSLLAKLRRAPRAEKVTVSAPLEAALLRLHDARVILNRLSGEE